MALPTPDDVQDLPLAGPTVAAFAAVSDAKIQLRIDRAAKLLGSAAVKKHTQRDDAVLLLTAHLLYLELKALGVNVGGGGGGNGGALLTGVSLDGVGSKSFGVQAQAAVDLNDWYKTWSPWSVDLHAILDSFPPSIVTAQWPLAGLEMSA
jgi:hypothetical protein